MKAAFLAVLLVAVLISARPASSAVPVRIMLLDRESGGAYHNWQAVTPALKKQLDETGLFQVDVVTAPPANGDPADHVKTARCARKPRLRG